jgi:hypothetical protein
MLLQALNRSKVLFCQNISLKMGKKWLLQLLPNINFRFTFFPIPSLLWLLSGELKILDSKI